MNTEPSSGNSNGSQIKDLISVGVAKRSRGEYVQAYEDLTSAFQHARTLMATSSQQGLFPVLNECLGEMRETIRHMMSDNVELKKAAGYVSNLVDTIRQLRKEFPEIEIRRSLVVALLYKGWFYEFEDIDWQKALACYQEEFDLVKEIIAGPLIACKVYYYINDEYYFCKSLDSIAGLYTHLREYDKAIASWQNLIAFAKEKAVEDDSVVWKDWIANSLYSISDCHNLAGTREAGLIYARESVAIRQKLNDELRTQKSGEAFVRALKLLHRIYRNLVKETEEKLLAVKSVNEAMWGKEKWVWNESNKLAVALLHTIAEQASFSFAIISEKEVVPETINKDFLIFGEKIQSIYKNQGMFNLDILKEAMPENQWLPLWFEYTKRNSGGDAGSAVQGSPEELLSWIIKSHKNMAKANPVLLDKLRKKNSKSETGDAE